MIVTITKAAGTSVVEMRLDSIGELFAAPEMDAFRRGGPLEDSGVAYAVSALSARRMTRDIRIVILLPPEQIGADLAEQTRDALRRLCADRLARLLDAERTERREGLSGLWGVSLEVLALTVGASYLVQRADFIDDYWQEFISTGLSVLGWVAMWEPIRMVVLPGFPARREHAVYRRLLNAEVEIRPAVPSTATA